MIKLVSITIYCSVIASKEVNILNVIEVSRWVKFMWFEEWVKKASWQECGCGMVCEARQGHRFSKYTGR